MRRERNPSKSARDRTASRAPRRDQEANRARLGSRANPGSRRSRFESRGRFVTRPIQFTQAQVRRAVKAAESAGLRVSKVTVKPDGSISVEAGENQTPTI